MMETITIFLNNLDNNVIIIAISIIILWIFAKAFRWILNCAIFVLLIAVVFWKVPALKQLFVSLLH